MSTNETEDGPCRRGLTRRMVLGLTFGTAVMVAAVILFGRDPGKQKISVPSGSGSKPSSDEVERSRQQAEKERLRSLGYVN
jgi:hypothetical protein